jgi:hypothetical protein
VGFHDVMGATDVSIKGHERGRVRIEGGGVGVVGGDRRRGVELRDDGIVGGIAERGRTRAG